MEIVVLLTVPIVIAAIVADAAKGTTVSCFARRKGHNCVIIGHNYQGNLH